MIELYLSKNQNEGLAAYGKYYPRVSYKQTMNIHDMAKHMAEHNTPFSEGTIEGILRDFVRCTREQTLMGNTVKVDDLAIFKVSVIGNGSILLYDPDTDKTISASIGTIGKNDKTGPAVQSLKLLAQATGEYTRLTKPLQRLPLPRRLSSEAALTAARRLATTAAALTTAARRLVAALTTLAVTTTVVATTAVASTPVANQEGGSV